MNMTFKNLVLFLYETGDFRHQKAGNFRKRIFYSLRKPNISKKKTANNIKYGLSVDLILST